MMGRSILQRLRQISISSSLRGAFLMGALLTLIVSSVSLYCLLAAANGRIGIASAFSSWQRRILRYGFTASREPAG